ncbi:MULTISPECIES: exopolysaccharide biosynthesis protein [Massilia]|uniref:Exopolysaccharide biosynthesis protein n=2 Tax=Massilia TaxID=149698 RepID=A0A422QN21_9BURK|nr:MULTISPECIES: exopolysaccharide biosynthesis protein [Massilia]MDY0962035.1 exopolysaccharide biosynthesis protein [Massilia sp. CFBP9026]MDY0977030.1 exopolysaccharide biosynthesis protein [Massilia sp. CFBP9012]RNF31387.1 exopolysaccharide biosynthesis protein [Massilia aurea]TXF97143.1 exopolysaccharide biosynthesis protein [Massilia arenae]
MNSAPISQTLRSLVRSLPRTGITLSELIQRVGNDGLLILVTLLTLVFLIPVSIPGVSTVFGAAILLISVSRLFGRNLWIPSKIEHRIIGTRKLRPLLRKALSWLKKLERVSRPNRIQWLVASGTMAVINNLALILGAVLLMMPFGLIPFSNTFPAVAILFLAIGLLQRDGLCILLGHVSNVVTILYFAVLIGGGGLAIREVFNRFAG